MARLDRSEREKAAAVSRRLLIVFKYSQGPFKYSKTLRVRKEDARKVTELWTHLMCEGQGSSVGVSMCESWDTFSGAHSSFSSTSASTLDPDNSFEPGTKVNSCCKKLSCLWTLLLAWTDVGP